MKIVSHNMQIKLAHATQMPHTIPECKTLNETQPEVFEKSVHMTALM